MVARVVATFPGCPKLLQWMFTGCGSCRALAAAASVSRIRRGVTALDPTASSSPVTLRAASPPPPPRFPARDAARIHDLDRVASGRAKQPRRILARACRLSRRQLAEQILVVAE